MMIEWILLLAGVYLAAGLVFAMVFHRWGLARLDPGVVGAGWFFRTLVTPGIVALWPLLLLKWRLSLRGGEVAGSAEAPLSPSALRSAHRWLVTFLALGLPPLLAGGLLLRPALPLNDGLATSPARPLPAELLSLEVPEEGLPIRGVIRGGPGGRRQIELAVDGDLEVPSLALFVCPQDGPGLPPEAVFIGPVYGSAKVLRYELPKRQAGVLIFYSLAEGRRLASWKYRIEYSAAPRGGS